MARPTDKEGAMIVSLGYILRALEAKPNLFPGEDSAKGGAQQLIKATETLTKFLFPEYMKD